MRRRIQAAFATLVIAQSVALAAPVVVTPGSVAGYVYFPASAMGGGSDDAARAAASAASCGATTTFSRVAIFNTPGGPFTWTVPADVGCIKIESAAAGGAGGRMYTANSWAELSSATYNRGGDGGNTYVLNSDGIALAREWGGWGGTYFAFIPYTLNLSGPNGEDAKLVIPSPNIGEGGNTTGVVYGPRWNWPSLGSFMTPPGGYYYNGMTGGQRYPSQGLNPQNTLNNASPTFSCYNAYTGWNTCYSGFTRGAGGGGQGTSSTSDAMKIPPKSVLQIYVGEGGVIAGPNVGDPAPVSKKVIPTYTGVIGAAPTYAASKAGGGGGNGHTCYYDELSKTYSSCTQPTNGNNGYVKIYY